MAEQHFSWLTEATLEAAPLPTPEERPNLASLKNRFLTHKKTLVGIFALFIILLVLKLTQEEKTTPPIRMEAMVAVLPVPKGQVIEGMLLRPVNISPSSISKNQKLNLLRPIDAEKIMGKLRAKKDIPPQKPIFWSELELIPTTKSTTQMTVPVVTYPEP